VTDAVAAGRGRTGPPAGGAGAGGVAAPAAVRPGSSEGSTGGGAVGWSGVTARGPAGARIGLECHRRLCPHGCWVRRDRPDRHHLDSGLRPAITAPRAMVADSARATPKLSALLGDGRGSLASARHNRKMPPDLRARSSPLTPALGVRRPWTGGFYRSERCPPASGEREAAGSNIVQHHARCVHIGRRPRCFSQALLWGPCRPECRGPRRRGCKRVTPTLAMRSP